MSLLCMTVLSLSAFGQGTPKLSALTKKYVHDIAVHNSKLEQGYIYNKGNDGTIYISAIIRVADATLAQNGLDAIGAHVGTKAGNIWTVKVPVEKVSSFIISVGIAYIQLDEPTYPQLDMARKTTRADSAQGGYDLPIGYSGKDVVVGVIDFGFDYNHPTFTDTTNTTYRIKKVWQMNGTAAPPAGYTYGKEIVGEAAIKAEGTDDPKQNHGTCTAGMAAGSGFGSPSTSPWKYRGMAYQSDLVMVGVRRDTIGGQWMAGSFSDFLDGVNYCFNYATSVSKPCVVNISWGSQSGSHDGTSLFNQACNTMSGPGKLVVMSAGNEGQENIHLSKTFTATDTVIQSFLTFNPTTVRRTWVDIWGEPSKTFCAKATLYTGGVATVGQTTGYKCIDDAVTDMYLIGANGIDTCFVQFITSSAEDNGKPRITVNINNKTTDTVLISVKGNSGKIDIWDEYYYYGFPYKYQSAFNSLGQSYATMGNTTSTVSDMGSATSVLLVGAYASKVNFTDINGNAWSYSSYVLANKLVPFSSRGPMIDGRISPDLTAPGLTIATSMSSYDTSYTATGSNSDLTMYKYTDGTGKDYYYTEFSGTSASAPAASGIVAMLLQANPNLTPAGLKTVLFSTIIKDTYTGAIPAAGNNNWGKGKINAYGALKQVLTDLSSFTYTGTRPDCVLYPNPSNGNFTLDYTANLAEPVSVSVYNVSGAMLYSKLWQVATGDNRMSIPLGDVAKGMYVVKVTSPKGSIAIQAVVK